MTSDLLTIGAPCFPALRDVLTRLARTKLSPMTGSINAPTSPRLLQDIGLRHAVSTDCQMRPALDVAQLARV
ncbi:MAG: hypothetical protein AAFP85_14010 [Pseudomonadota bacterium]